MKKKLPKGKFRCGACNKILSTKDSQEHFKSKEHMRKVMKIKEAYEARLKNLTNFEGL